MASRYNTFIYAILSLVLILLPLPSHSADPSPLQDFCVADLKSPIHINGFPCINPANVLSKDFFFQGLQQPAKIFDGFGVNITQGSVNTFPALNTLGISMNRVEVHPGGVNPPHVHPRATQLSIVLQGSLFVGLVSTTNVFYSKTVTAGEMFVIPPGLVHFELNVGKGDAIFLASFNSQNPGVQRVPPSLFATTPPIPDELLAKAFHVKESIIDIIRSGFKILEEESSYMSM